MCVFLDYDMYVGRGREQYALRANTRPLPYGASCVVYPSGSGWTRKTKWANANGSIRYEWFASLDVALTAGVRWFRRRAKALTRE